MTSCTVLRIRAEDFRDRLVQGGLGSAARRVSEQSYMPEQDQTHCFLEEQPGISQMQRSDVVLRIHSEIAVILRLARRGQIVAMDGGGEPHIVFRLEYHLLVMVILL